LAIAQYVAGSVALKSVPPVTLPPCIIFSFTGFQIFAPAGGLNAGPYFHVDGSNGPWLTAPGGATVFALLSLPAGAASGKVSVPGAALFAYGSARGVLVAGGVCGAGGFDDCAANAAIASATHPKSAIRTFFMFILPSEVVRTFRSAVGQA
jgi:hypothetical protein